METKSGASAPLSAALRRNIRQYTMIAALVVIWAVFSALTGSIFLSPRNLSNLFLQSATIATLAVGLVLVVVSGNLDLSLGSVAGFIGAVVAVLQVNRGAGTLVSIAAALGIGALVGLWHGYWIAYRRVSALIVTLGSMMIFKGGLIGVTGGATVGPMNADFKAIGQGYLPRISGAEGGLHDTSLLLGLLVIAAWILAEFRTRAKRRKYGFALASPLAFGAKLAAVSAVIAAMFLVLASYKGVPLALILVLALALLFNFLARDTTFGRRVFAIGGNREAATLSGIDTKLHILVVYVLMGLMTAMAGIVFTARLNAASATAGNLFELDAVAAVVIGGTSLAGGEGSIAGALVGALVMASLDNGMGLMDMDVTFQYVLKGLILVLAVWVDTMTRSRGKSS